MDPQAFLMDRVNQIKNLLTGDASLQSTATTFAPGGALGKGATSLSLGMLRTAGKPGQSQMSLLGGDAPVYETGFDELLDTPVRKLVPDMPGFTAASGALQDVISRLQ